MPLLAGLGSTGIGLVWGWMLGWLEPVCHRPRTVSAAAAASLLLAGSAWFFAHLAGAVAFAAGAAAALLCHLAALRRRE